ncbi:hypothetical protein ACFVFJ_49585 [Streptomyces sp. NPDC057717]
MPAIDEVEMLLEGSWNDTLTVEETDREVPSEWGGVNNSYC